MTLEPNEKRIFFKAFGYEPNVTQKAIHDARVRILQVAGGERAGKSRTGSADMSAEAAAAEPNSLFWIVGPDYAQARPELFYCLQDLQKIDAIADVSIPKEGPCQITLRGGTVIQTKSGEDAIKLASFAPRGILMTEAAQHSAENFVKLANRTAEARGWLKLTGTFESSLGWYADLFLELQNADNKWEGKSISLPTWSNTAIFPGGENDPEILRLRATNDPDLFLERFGGIPCPPRGIVFKTFKYGTHVVPTFFGNVETAVQTDKGWELPADTRVELWVDPGYAGAYSVLFAALDTKRVWLLDEVYAVGQIAENVIAQTRLTGDLFERVQFHQRRNGIGGVIDIAARQHAGMESHEEIWRRLGGVIFRAQPVPIVDGIHRHRTFLKDPLTDVPRLFHDPKVKGTIREYGLYKYHEDSDNRGTNELPIDKNNHSMKAIAYGLTANYGFVDGARTVDRVPTGFMEKAVEQAISAKGKRYSGKGWLA